MAMAGFHNEWSYNEAFVDDVFNVDCRLVYYIKVGADIDVENSVQQMRKDIE